MSPLLNSSTRFAGVSRQSGHMTWTLWFASHGRAVAAAGGAAGGATAVMIVCG